MSTSKQTSPRSKRDDSGGNGTDTSTNSPERAAVKRMRNRLLGFNLGLMALIIIIAFVVIYQLQYANLTQMQERFGGVMGEFYEETLGGTVTTVRLTNLVDEAQRAATEQGLQNLLIGLSALGIVLIAGSAGISYLVARRATRPLEQAFDQQQRFVADASHEFRTPLAIIGAYVDVLRSKPDATIGSQGEWLDTISAQTHALSRLTDDLLLLAGGTARPPAPEPLDLSALVNQQVVGIEVLAFERGITLESRLAEPVTLESDPGLLARLVAILLENALKYVDTGGRIELATHADPPRLVISNTGAGILPDDLPHIFERFYRADTTRTPDAVPAEPATATPSTTPAPTKPTEPAAAPPPATSTEPTPPAGFGLGLCVARDIADRIGATLNATSTPNELTTFTLSF